MTKLALGDWASVAEIIGTTAVVVSLLIVAYSVNHNTAAIQAANDNLLYEHDMKIGSDVVNDASLAAILVKVGDAQPLSAVEEVRFVSHKIRYIDMWELAFDRYNDGLMSEKKWHAWNASLAESVTQGGSKFPQEIWDLSKDHYSEGFIKIVDNAYAASD